MDEKLTVDIDRETLEALSRQAESRGHSLDEEVRDIIVRNVRRPMTREEFLRRAEAIAAMTPKGIPQTDSTILIREDRDR